MKLPRPFALLRSTAAILIAMAFISWPSIARAEDPTWHAEYFANDTLSGTPTLVRSDNDLNFDWGLGSPDPSIPVDHFSARWTRKVNFPSGAYRFNASVDDGVRLYVDGQLVMDQWHITAPITYSTSIVNLPTGDHDIKVEYFENTERAQFKVWWDAESGDPAAVPVPTHVGLWHGQYFNNKDLSGTPTFERDDSGYSSTGAVAVPGAGSEARISRRVGSASSISQAGITDSPLRPTMACVSGTTIKPSSTNGTTPLTGPIPWKNLLTAANTR